MITLNLLMNLCFQTERLMDEFEFVSLDTDCEDEVIFSQLVPESVYDLEIDAEEVGEIEKSSSSNSYNGKDGTLWSKHPSTKSSKTTSKKLINFRCGPTTQQPLSELDRFLKFITNEMLKEIVHYTNLFIESTKIEIEKEQLHNTEVPKLSKFFAVPGTSKQPEIKDELNEVRIDSIATIKAPPTIRNYGFDKFDILKSLNKFGLSDGIGETDNYPIRETKFYSLN
ncbi:hypothetical protein BLOT_016646 [Blomia tropicalis]|nr:hypothetical protein BLOT_016646 [Blomia tropicalis]